MFGIGPSMARQRMKDNQTAFDIAEMERQKAKQKMLQNNQQQKPKVSIYKRVKENIGAAKKAIHDNKPLRKTSEAVGYGVSKTSDFIEKRLPSTPKVGSRAKKGLYNSNRGFQL